MLDAPAGAATSTVTLGTVTMSSGVTGTTAGVSATVVGDVTPTVTGTVTYTLYNGSTCTGTVISTDLNVAVNGDGTTYPAFDPGNTLAAGQYSFGAVFNGPDSNGNDGGSGCGGFAVGAAPPGISGQVVIANTANPWGASQPVGTAAQMTASVTGFGGFAPTGTVQYGFYSDGTCTGTASGSSSGVSGSSAATVALPNGTYSFQATYPGDGNYSAGQSSCLAFAVASGSGTVTFSNIVNDAGTGQPWSATETTGATASQNVTVNGVGGITPTGTVTVQLFASGTCGTGTIVQSANVTLAGGSGSSAASSPLAAGTYVYQDVYSGDSNYAANQSACSAPFTVGKGTPTVTSTVYDAATNGPWPANPAPPTGAKAYDTSAVHQSSGVTAFAPSGTVTYELFNVGTGSLPCTGSPASSQTVNLSGGAVPNSSTTTSLNKGGYAFEVIYNGDGNWASLPGDCESFNVALGTPTVSIGNLPGSGSSVEFNSFVAQVSTNGDGPTSVSSSTTSVCTVGTDGHTVSFVFYGTCTLTPVVGVGNNYGTATGSSSSLSVTAAPRGYWLVGSDGGIFTFGHAAYWGSMGATRLQRPVVGITPTFNKAGYWLVASDGGVFAFGDSSYYGSLPGLGLHPAGSGLPSSLNAPVVGIVPSATQHGYFMVASDGGVFAFGDAHFAGSCPGIGGCVGSAVSVLPDHSGNGYWLVTNQGYVYAFGDAGYYGAAAPFGVAAVDAIATPDGHGYWILYSNGTVMPFGDASSLGAPLGYVNQYNPATAIFITQDGHGYWVTSTRGDVFSYGNAPFFGGMAATNLNGAIIAAYGF